MSMDSHEGLAAGTVTICRCADCGLHQTLDPYFCARCGSARMTWMEASGRGLVYAATQVHRAPSPQFEALLPYTLVLVDMDDGGRLMGHGEPGLTIGAVVNATVFQLADRSLVRFVATEQAR